MVSLAPSPALPVIVPELTLVVRKSPYLDYIVILGAQVRSQGITVNRRVQYLLIIVTGMRSNSRRSE